MGARLMRRGARSATTEGVRLLSSAHSSKSKYYRGGELLASEVSK